MNNEEKILGILETMQGQIGTIQDQMKTMQEEIGSLGERMKSFDGHMDLLQRQVDTMQDQLDGVQETATRVAITQENTVMKTLNLLAEGHTTIMDRMPRKSRIEALEEDVATLKSIVQFHSSDIAELKAAK